MKPYAYRRWRICYVAARSVGHHPFPAAILALVGMDRIQITVKKGQQP